MSCGRNNKVDGVLDKIGQGIDAVDGIAADIDKGISNAASGIASAIDSAISGIAGAVKEVMPEINLPELPALPSFNIPDLLAPEISLQNQVCGLTRYLNNEATFDPRNSGLNAQLATIEDYFGDVIDVDKLREDLLAGRIDQNNCCKLIPNYVINAKGEIVLRGKPVTTPLYDAEDCIKPATAPEFVTYPRDDSANTTWIEEKTDRVLQINNLDLNG